MTAICAGIDLPACAAARFIHRGIGGVEFFDFPAAAMETLDDTCRGLAAQGYRRMSFHAPMPRPAHFPFDGVTCFFLNEDPAKRELSFHVVEESLRHARNRGAAYVVTHLNYGRTDTSDAAIAGQLARSACARLAELSRSYGVPIHIEFAAYTTAFHEPRGFVEVVAPHRELGICLDIGHARIGAALRRRDYFSDICVLAPHARSMHLWNTRGDGPEHVPLHPSQSPAEGWIDVERTLAAVLTHCPDIPVVFEYPVEKLTPDIQAGYDWVGRMVTAFRADKNE